MMRYSRTAAARRFAEVLKEADKEPVFIDWHGRPRSVVISKDRYDLYTKLLVMAMDEMTVDSIHDSLDAAREGRFKTAARLRMQARLLARAPK